MIVQRPGKRMSRHVAATLLTTAALTCLAGCANNSTTARCVDANGNVLPDSACGGYSAGYGGGSGYIGYGGYSPGYPPRWVYGGQGGSRVGSRAIGYSTVAPSDGDISTSSGRIIRGGFGRSGGFFGWHGGG